MALYGQGFSLRSLLEDPNLQNPPNLNKGGPDLKKPGKFGGYVNNTNSAFLGSNLWDKHSNADSNSNDFDLEYMDLDEFLSENGIPVDPDENESQTISLLASALARSPPRSPNPGSPSLMIDPLSPGNSRAVTVSDESEKMTSFSNISSPVGQPSSPLGHMIGSPQNIQGEKSSQSVIERYLMDDDFGIKMPSPKTDCKTEPKESNRKRKLTEMDPYPIKSQDMSVVSIPVYHSHQPRSVSSMPSPGWEPQGHDFDNDDCSSEDDTNFINNMIPGQDGFDPKARKFSSEELKPQPIIKKAKKIFVDEHAKDEKYWQRRKKNNVAAKRSREARRVKENQIAMRAAFLEEENDKLRKSYEKLQRENDSLLKRLSKYESMD